MEKFDLHPWRNALVKLTDTGHFLAEIMNSTSNSINVPRDSYNGDLHFTSSQPEVSRRLWRQVIMEIQEDKPKSSVTDKSSTLPKFMIGSTNTTNSKERLRHLITYFELDNCSPVWMVVVPFT